MVNGGIANLAMVEDARAQEPVPGQEGAERSSPWWLCVMLRDPGRSFLRAVLFVSEGPC